MEEIWKGTASLIRWGQLRGSVVGGGGGRDVEFEGRDGLLFVVGGVFVVREGGSGGCDVPAVSLFTILRDQRCELSFFTSLVLLRGFAERREKREDKKALQR